MTTFLKEVAVTAERPLQSECAAVENMSRVVCALLIDGLQNKIATPEFWKISIRINSREISENGKILLGVLVIGRDFPARKFVDWQKRKRQNFMLDFVAEVLRDVFSERKINTLRVDEAVQYVVAQNFRRLIIGRKRFHRPDRKSVARIECEQEIDEARIYIVLSERGMESRRLLVTSTVPEEFIFQSFFGSIEWNEALRPRLRKVDGATVEFNSD